MRITDPLNIASAIFIALFACLLAQPDHAKEQAIQERLERQAQLSLPELVAEINAKCPILGSNYDVKKKNVYSSKSFRLHHISHNSNDNSIYVILGDNDLFQTLDRKQYSDEWAGEKVADDLNHFSNLDALMPKLYEGNIKMICIVTDLGNTMGGGHKVEYRF